MWRKRASAVMPTGFATFDLLDFAGALAADVGAAAFGVATGFLVAALTAEVFTAGVFLTALAGALVALVLLFALLAVFTVLPPAVLLRVVLALTSLTMSFS